MAAVQEPDTGQELFGEWSGSIDPATVLFWNEHNTLKSTFRLSDSIHARMGM